MSPKSSTPKKLAHVGHAAPTLAVMSESEISEDEATASPVKTKSIHPLRNTLLKKLEISSISSPSDKLPLQENCVEKEICRKDTEKVLNPVIKNINQDDNIKSNAEGAEGKRGKTSPSIPKDDEKSINSVDQESSVENNECDLGEDRGSNNSSFSDVLEAKSLEIEKNLMALEEMGEKKSDKQKSSDSANVQCIMDEMIVRLNVLQPFEDPKTRDRKPEEKSACHQIVCSPPVNVCDLTSHVGATEIIGNLSHEDDDDSSPMDDWEIVEKEKVIEVTTRRKEVTQEKLVVGSKSGSHISETVNNVLSINCTSEITSDSVGNNASSIRTSDKFSDKSSNPKIADESVIHKDEVGKAASGTCELQTKADFPCDNGRILESNVHVNPPFSDLDHIPDSGFNSPESPVAEIGELNVLFEKDHCSNSCVTETLRDLVSLRDSVLSLDDALKYPYSSEVMVKVAEEVPKISPEALPKGTPKNNYKEEFKSPHGQKAKKSPEKGKSPLNHESCTVNDNQSSVSKVRRSRRLMKEAEESFSSSIQTKSQSPTQEVSISPKDTRTKEVTSSPKSNFVKNNEMDVSGCRTRSRKGKTSDEKVDLLDSSLNILESDDEVKALETRVKKRDACLKEGEECSVLQKEIQISNSGSNKETSVSCSVSVAEKVEITPNANANSQVAQTLEKIGMHSEVNDDAVSSPGDEGSSVLDTAENNDIMSEFCENTSSKSDDMMSCFSEDDDNDVDLQKSFGENDLTSDGGPRCTNSNVNKHLDSGANNKIDLNYVNIAGSNYPQALNIIEKEVNSSEMPEIFLRRNDAQKESLSASKQMECQMGGVKTSGVASSSIPSFNELNIECSTPISKYSGIPKDFKQAFKLFLNVMNPQMISKPSIENDASLSNSEMYSKKEDPNKNSADSIEEMNSDKERSKDLGMFDDAEGKLDSSIQYPLSVQHLSFLKKPFRSPLDFLVKEKSNPKSTILVRCNYKNSSRNISDMKTIDSSVMLEDESLLSKSSNTHNSCTPCEFTVQNSQAKGQEKDMQKMKRNPCSAGKRKLNFNVIRRPIVPFFFGSCNLSTVFKVKFWIGGHFSMESFVDAYSFPKNSVVGFGHGDLKGLTPSKTANSASKSPPKFSGVKYSKKGTLASFSYADQYLSPTKPLLSLFSKKPNFSAFVTANSDSSAADIHGRKISENIDDKSKMKTSQAKDQVPQESELLIESGSNRNANAAAIGNTNCDANGHGNLDRSENANAAAIGNTNCDANGHGNLDRSENANAAAIGNTNCDANGHGNLDRSENAKSPTNLVASAIIKNTDCSANGNGNLDRSEKAKSPAYLVPSAVRGSTNCASNRHRNLDKSEIANPAANVVLTAVVDGLSSSESKSGDSKAVNSISDIQEKTTETEVECSLFESQSDGKENANSPKELLVMDSSTKNGSFCSSGSSFVSPSTSVIDVASKEVDGEEIHRSDDIPIKLSSPKRTEVVSNDSIDINLSPASSRGGDKPKVSKISKVEDQFSTSGIRKHSLPHIIQRKSSVTPINRNKSCVNPTSGKVENSEALRSCINLASLDSSAVPADDRVSFNVTLSKEESLLSKRKLQDVLDSNGEPLGKKIISKAVEGGDTFQEMVSSASNFGAQSESDDGELMIDPENNDNLITEMSPQEEDEHLSEAGSSLSADALLESGSLLHGVGKQSASEATGSLTKILKRRKLCKVRDKEDTETIHPCRNRNGNVPMKKKTELKDSEAKALTEAEVYENPPKKRRIAHSPSGNPESKSSDSPSSKGDYPAIGQTDSESTSVNLTDSNSLILLDNSVLIVGEPEEQLGEMFGSPEVHALTKSNRKPRKQTFDRIRRGANLQYSPPPQEVYRMLFGDIEDDNDKEPEVDDSMTFKDPDNLCGDLNDSVDKLYEKTKKIRIAHTPKTKPAIEKEVQSIPEESNKIELSKISIPFGRKSIISSNNFNQKPKVKQSKLEKLRSQIAKARGLFGRAVVDPNLPTTTIVKADLLVKCKVTTNMDAEEEKCTQSAKEKTHMSKSASISEGDKLEGRVKENGISSDVNNHKPQKDQVSTNEVSSNEKSEEPGDEKREVRKAANELEKVKRKKGKNFLSGKRSEEVASEEELNPRSKKAVITRDGSVEEKSGKVGKQINRKKSYVTVNGSEQESSSGIDLDLSLKEQELISPKRGLKNKFAHEDGEKATRSSKRLNVISPRKTVTKKTVQGKKGEVSMVIPDSESLTTSDFDSGRGKELAPKDGGMSSKSSRSEQDVTEVTYQENKRKASVEVADSGSPETSDLDSGKESKKTSHPMLLGMLSKTVNSGSAKDIGVRKSSFSDSSALEKEKVGKESGVLPASSSEESKSNSVQEGYAKEPSKKTFEGGSSICEDGIANYRNKDNRPTEEFLESMEVPPLSPLSSDELVDSFILCCDGDNDNWSPMKPSNKDSDKGDSSKLPESLATSQIIIPETLSTEDSRAHLDENPAECEPQERVRDFFFNIVQEYKGRNYYQSNQGDPNPGDKEALKCLLGRLHKKNYRTEDMDNLIEGLNDETKNFQSKSVAKYLVRILRKEDEDDVQHPVVHGAPRLSEMQLRVLTLVLALERRCPRFSDLIDIILKGISFFLFRLGHAPEVEVIMPLARMYTVFCKVRKDLQTARTFCYDALFCLGLKAYALIFIVLSVWPEVFRKQDNGKDPDAIESSILIALMELKIFKKKGEIKVVPVQNILKNAYKCQHQSIKSDDFIKKLMLEMRGGIPVEGAQAATILLCKKKGWDWTHGNLLCQNLVSILEDYERGNISVNAAATAVKLIGFISRSCSMETAGPVKPIVDYLYEAMNNQEKYPMAIQEAIAQSLICLSRFYIHRVAHALDIWTPSTTPSEELVKKMTNLVRNPHKGFWGRYFGQWRKRPKMPKDALVPFKTGVYFTDADVSNIMENSGEESMELERSDLEVECEGDGEGNKGVMKRMNGLKVRGGKAGHCRGGVRHRGGWIGSKGRAVQRNARWVGMLRSESNWVKAEEKKWDEIAWVKKVSIPSAERREAESLMKYEGNIFN
ncbi:hypothetical protein J437_LFUL007796 [Ladona fulva]|uniref:Uncharacterized protein n=1 Tax=Ladona fulva TaxID=123851 RepID=A0A8K0JU46_LADFU|nr:hypothetical protein J437_LFUL007796 [Ladona fulva]